MRVQALMLFASLVAIVAAWTAQDREIFHLRDAVEKDIGEGKTFYDWLKIPKSATDVQITKAYRKLSQRLHPDKVKNHSKSATERFARLGLVHKVLRSEGRDRYDFFLNKGFPRWKGTDYYYSRYRPGLLSVIVFLYVLSAVVQYSYKKLTASGHRKHMTMIIEEAKQAAWNGGMPTSQRKVTFPNGKVFMVFPGGAVSLIDEEDGAKQYPLDINDIVDPTWKETIIYTLPMALYYKVTGKRPVEPIDGHVVGTTDDATTEDGKSKKLKPKAAQKVGATRRRK